MRHLSANLFLFSAVGMFAPTAALGKAAVHNCAIENMAFAPAEIDVALGDTLIWTNKDIVPHTVTATDGSFDSKLIEPGKTWRLVVRKKGTLGYKCLYHPNMKARIVVR